MILSTIYPHHHITFHSLTLNLVIPLSRYIYTILYYIFHHHFRKRKIPILRATYVCLLLKFAERSNEVLWCRPWRLIVKKDCNNVLFERAPIGLLCVPYTRGSAAVLKMCKIEFKFCWDVVWTEIKLESLEIMAEGRSERIKLNNTSARCCFQRGNTKKPSLAFQ